jgi:hypothetical protein
MGRIIPYMKRKINMIETTNQFWNENPIYGMKTPLITIKNNHL